MSQPLPEPLDPDTYEAWRNLQDVLEERDREYWADETDDE